LRKVKELGGTTIIQAPSDCRVDTMPQAAKKITAIDYEYSTNEIIIFLLALQN